MNKFDMDEYVRQLVRSYAVEHLDKTDEECPAVQVYIVWQCFILGHKKWLVSTTLPDGMYYEVTYDSGKRSSTSTRTRSSNRCVKEAAR